MNKKISKFFHERIPIDTDTLTKFGSEPVPGHLKSWWWCLGGTPAYLFLVQLVTGILLSLYYVPSPDHAYESVRKITEEITYGWYFRSLHKWSSNFMIVVMILHMIRVFFTGAYRKPRELNWMVGFGILMTVLIFGFTGYSLVYEQLSFWGITVASNLTESVPFVGPLIANFMRGGPDITAVTLTRFYILHIGLIPTIFGILITSHFILIRVHGVTEFHFEKESEEEKKSFPFFPDHFYTELGIGVTLMFVLTILAIIFPVGLEDMANPLITPAHIKPEWYFYFTFRWLKLTSLTFAILSLGFGAFLAILWPFIDSLLRKKNIKSEISMIIGALAFITLLTFTIWETLSLFYSH